jgi:hypothetical protein
LFEFVGAVNLKFLFPVAVSAKEKTSFALFLSGIVLNAENKSAW